MKVIFGRPRTKGGTIPIKSSLMLKNGKGMGNPSSDSEVLAHFSRGLQVHTSGGGGGAMVLGKFYTALNQKFQINLMGSGVWERRLWQETGDIV